MLVVLETPFTLRREKTEKGRLTANRKDKMMEVEKNSGRQQ